MRPVAVSQSLTTPFLSPEARVSPPGLNATQRTAASWPRSRVAGPPRRHVPEPDGPVLSGRGEDPPGGMEGHAVDRADMAGQDACLGKFGQVPELDGQVMACGGEPGAVRAEGDVVDRATVAPQGAGLSPLFQSQSLTLGSALDEASHWPSGLKATPQTAPSWPLRIPAG